jgi:hypothetical protein
MLSPTTQAEAERVMEAAMERASIKSFDQEREAVQTHERFYGSGVGSDAILDQLISSWRARADALRENPDA